MAGKTDPFDVWRQWLDRSERQINTMLNEFTSSPKFGKAQARLMESLLKTQQGMNHAAERYFTTINLPTRTDILELGGRLTEVEDRLANIESVLLSLAGKSKPERAASRRTRPARTRKPPTGKGTETRTKTKATKKKSSTKKSVQRKASKKAASKKVVNKGPSKKSSAKPRKATVKSTKKKRTTRKAAAKRKPAKKRRAVSR